MFLLTLRDLVHRRIRFVVVTLLGAVVFALLFVMTGLVEQFNREPYDTVDAIGADHWIIPAGVSGPFTSSSTLPSDLADTDPDWVPVVVGRSSFEVDGELEEVIVIGHPIGAELGPAPVADGSAVTAEGEVVIDRSLGAGVGDEGRIAGSEVRVVGRSDDTTVFVGIPLVFVPIQDAQALLFGTDQVVSALLTDAPVTDVPDGTNVLTADEVATDVLGPVESAISSVDLVRALLWIVAAVIIGAVVYLSALERQRDFAVLKAMGTSNRTLLASLALQAVLVALCAVAVGAALQLVVAPSFPLKVRVPPRAFWQLPLLALVVALIAGAAGMRRVARSDPALAFGGPGA